MNPENKSAGRQRTSASRLSVLNPLFTIFVITFMVFLAQFTGQREIIFPEIAALCAGCFLSPALSWNTSYTRMFVTITVCSVLGVLIVLFVPAPLTVQFLLAFVVGQSVLFISSTGFAPLISSICLPVLIQTTTPVYIASAAGFTLLLILLRIFLERLGLKPRRPFNPGQITLPAAKNAAVLFAFRTAAVTLITFAALKFNYRFVVAPPLLVAFVELTNSSNPVSQKKIKAAFLVILCAITSAALRYLLCIKIGLPLTFAAFIAALFIILFYRCAGLYFPPAGAMAVLPFLIPEQVVPFYPLQAAAGMILLASFAHCFVKTLSSRA